MLIYMHNLSLFYFYLVLNIIYSLIYFYLIIKLLYINFINNVSYEVLINCNGFIYLYML